MSARDGAEPLDGESLRRSLAAPLRLAGDANTKMSCSGVVGEGRWARRLCQEAPRLRCWYFHASKRDATVREAKQKFMNPSSIRIGRSGGCSHLLTLCPQLMAVASSSTPADLLRGHRRYSKEHKPQCSPKMGNDTAVLPSTARPGASGGLTQPDAGHDTLWANATASVGSQWPHGSPT